MTKLLKQEGPFLKNKNSTHKMMRNLLIALTPIILFSVYKNGYLPYSHQKTNILGLFYPLLFIMLPTFTTFLTELLYTKYFLKKNKEELMEFTKNSFSIVPGLFLGLILPINTPLSIVILGAVFATIIGKMLFGGFGYNIFNPALVGRLFIISTYALVITNHGGYMNPLEVDTITTATPLSNVSIISGIGTYETLVKPYGNLWDFLIGTIPGAMGETSALLCIIAGIFLSITKVIKWKIPLIYILTVFGMTYLIGGMNGLGIWYPLFQVLSGGLLFGAVFMATDPVTSPVTPIGQILYGLFLGILTVVFRYLTPYPEGVLTSILTMNMFVFILDKIGRKSQIHFWKCVLMFVIAWAIIIEASIFIGNKYDKRNHIDSKYKIVSKKVLQDGYQYIVTYDGYASKIKASIEIKKDKITKFEVIEQNESFYNKIEQANYIDKLLKEQQKIEEIDTISGATITSTAIKKIFILTLQDAKNGKDQNIETNDPITTSDFIIKNKEKKENKTIYTVETKSFGGMMTLQITLQSDKVETVEIVSYHDTYLGKLEQADYINKVIQNQNNLDTVDTISGATISSNAIKIAIQKTIEEHEKQNE